MGMPTIRVMSDLHLEFHPDKGQSFIQHQDPTGVDVLVLAGDIAIAEYLPNVLRHFCAKFRNVVFVAGNHEFYGSSLPEVRQLLSDLSEKYPSLHWLDNRMVEIENVKFAGTTMWYGDDPLNDLFVDGMNDFTMIRPENISYTDTDVQKFALLRAVTEENRQAKEFLASVMSQADVVVTHHAPTTESLTPSRRGSVLDRFYYCDMSRTMLYSEPAPQVWFHGHTHTLNDYMCGVTRVISNTLGYVPDHVVHGFNPNLMVEIPPRAA